MKTVMVTVVVADIEIVEAIMLEPSKVATRMSQVTMTTLA